MTRRAVPSMATRSMTYGSHVRRTTSSFSLAQLRHSKIKDFSVSRLSNAVQVSQMSLQDNGMTKLPWEFCQKDLSQLPLLKSRDHGVLPDLVTPLAVGEFNYPTWSNFGSNPSRPLAFPPKTVCKVRRVN